MTIIDRLNKVVTQLNKLNDYINEYKDTRRKKDCTCLSV